MGLIHSRASKKRAKAEAKLADEQRKQLKREAKAAKGVQHATPEDEHRATMMHP